jgi:hypothetical protein
MKRKPSPKKPRVYLNLDKNGITVEVGALIHADLCIGRVRHVEAGCVIYDPLPVIRYKGRDAACCDTTRFVEVVGADSTPFSPTNPLQGLAMPPAAAKCLAVVVRLAEMQDEIEAMVKGVHLNGTFVEDPSQWFGGLQDHWLSAMQSHLSSLRKQQHEDDQKMASEKRKGPTHES